MRPPLKLDPRLLCDQAIVAVLVALGGLGSLAWVQAIELKPVPLLLGEPASPSIWFGPADRAELRRRKGDAGAAKHLRVVKTFVDARIKQKLAGRSDDELSKIAKGAALLANLGEAPAAAAVYPSYGHAAAAALQELGPRSAARSAFQLLARPADRVNILQDCSRLQSALEGYDMLRGGVWLKPGSAADKAVRARLAQWANALSDDVEMGFHPADNWSAKSGAALVTAALVLSDHADAASWLKQGQVWLNGALQVKATDSGWYRESSHYLNYTLNNLVSTAHHVRQRTGVDWFEDLRPFVEHALACRLPDGQMAAFEEGVPCTFPFDVMASAYPDLGPTMMWAWANSPRNANAFENQQLHAATRFLVVPNEVVAAPPKRPPFHVLADEAKTVVLRSDWTKDALQSVLFCANDDKAGGTASRHVTQNPLDLVLFGHGHMRVATSSGGPLVTRSKRRSYYLDPANKNLPLIDGSAPYILDAGSVVLSDMMHSNGFSSASVAIPGVRRTVVQFEKDWTLVVDRFAPDAGELLSQVWHPLGTHTNLVVSPRFLHNRWTLAGPAVPVMDVYTFADVDLVSRIKPGFYVPKWAKEEAVQGLRVDAKAVGEEAVKGGRSTTISSLFVCRKMAGKDAPRPLTNGFRFTAGGQATVVFIGPCIFDAFASDAAITLVQAKQVCCIDAGSVRLGERVIRAPTRGSFVVPRPAVGR